MGALRAVASARVSRAGGAKHLAYISRQEALRPGRPGEETRDERDTAPVFEQRLGKGGAEVKGASAAQPEKEASHKAAHAGKNNESSLREADAIYTWNTPAYVTGDSYGTRDERSEERRKARLERGLELAGVAAAAELQGERRLTLEDKAERAVAYFGLLSDSEKKRGGVNSYRVVLTVGGEADARDMRGAVNEFLRETFPKAQALVAIHHNTKHVHAHVYVHSRGLDGKKLDLKQDYFRLDEKWARVCSEHFRDPTIYAEHMRLKAETRDHRREEKAAREGGKTLPDKPGRWEDRYEILRGPVRPWDDRYIGRLMAVGRVAEAKAGYLRVTGAAPSRLAAAEQEAQELRGKLESVAAKRGLARSEAKRSLPAEIVTIEERRELTLYSKAAAREAPTAERKAEAGKAYPVQASFDFGDAASRQLELWTETRVTEKFAASSSRKGAKGSSASTRKRGGKSEARAAGKTLPAGGGKEQSPGRERDKTMAERDALGRAMVAEGEVGRLRAELAWARENGDKWRLKVYDARHGRERVVSEFEIKRRCEALAKRAVEDRGVGDVAERRDSIRRELDGELTKHRYGIGHHREVVGGSIQALDEQLSAAEHEYEKYGPGASEIQARYAAAGQRLPLPTLTSVELGRLQDQAVAAKDTKRFLELEGVREGLAAERGGPARDDKELARLRGQLVAAGADLKASEHRKADFESGRHLEAWEVNGEAWSLTDVDRRINRLSDQARILVDPYSLIPQLTDPVRQAVRLTAKLGKNLNLSRAKRAEAAREVERLLEVRALVEGQVAAKGGLLDGEVNRASEMRDALGEVYGKEVARREQSGRAVPPPKLTASELNRLGRTAQLTKDVKLLAELNSLEEAHSRGESGGEEANARRLCARAAGREIVAEIAARESKEKLAEFEARKNFVHVVVKDGEGRDLSLSLADLKEPRRLVEYVARRALESAEGRRLRRAVERAVEAEGLRLRAGAEKAKEFFEAVRGAAHGLRARSLERNAEAPAPVFTPQEINSIELYSIRQPDPKLAGRLQKLIDAAEREGRVIDSPGSAPAIREAPNRERLEMSRAQPLSAEGRKAAEAHAWALQELKAGGREDALLRSPEEFAVSLSAEVRRGLKEKHGLSLESLGYTKEAWADAVLIHTRAALNAAGAARGGPAFERAVQSLELMKHSLDEGDRRLVERLSGPDRRSEESSSREASERGVKRKKGGRNQIQDGGRDSREWEGKADRGAADVRENSRTERLDRLEHTLTR